MLKHFCDICGHDTVEHSMEDLFGSRKITVQLTDINSTEERCWEMTLCNSCKERMYYLISNPVLLEKKIESLSLRNRIRCLFRKKIRQEGGA